MAERSRRSLGNPLPTTPQRRGGHLENLLAQFGSQKSAESATKLRRTSSQVLLKPEPAVAPSDVDSKRTLRSQQAPPTRAIPSPHNSNTPGSPERKVPRRASTRKVAPKTIDPSPTESISADSDSGSDTSEDELARPVRARGYKKNLRSNEKYSDLKMEARKKTGDDAPRRRSGRHTRVLESDTVQVQQRATPPKRKTAQPPRLDTARARLRDDIAHKTKAKANNFLIANKDFFLPLLPPNNYVSKLVANHKAKPIVQYEELTKQPKGVTATMKPYQLSGLSYMVYLFNNGFSGILGDEMGLGKTLQTLSLFQYLEELDRKQGAKSEELRPYLVVCPLSVLNSWVTEAQRWVPELKVLRMHGNKNERDRLKRVALGMEDMQGNETEQLKGRKASRKAGLKVSAYEDSGSSYKIIVTTYDTFQADSDWFKRSFLWRYVVLDEGHKIKSNTTNISTSLRNISSEYRMILTGTPLQNNLLEMWALLAWLYPDVFTDNTQELFKESFDLARGKVNKKTMDDARRLLELVMLRRMKDSPNVNLGLPPKEEVLLYVPLTPMQRFWYTRLLTRVDQGMLNDLFANGKEKEKAAIDQDKQDDELLDRMKQLESKPDTIGGQGEWEETAEIMRQAIEKEKENSAVTNKSAWQKLMNLVMQLRKCCSHPYLLPGVSPNPYYLGEHVIRASGKFILLEKLLKHTIFEQGKKVLIFSGFTHTLDCCEDLLSLISDHGQKFRHLRLDGGTGRARRNLDIRLFNQEGSDYKVMLLSTRAGGLGINLTSAQDVIFLDEDWNPQITLQAEARAHRIGQTKPVTIYKLCTQGTVEEQMMGRIRKKLYLSTKITESMRNIHDEQTPAKGKASMTDEMPQMDSTQLKTLIRRGAQTLSHPEIDVTEMLSWDLPTMMANCRDKPADDSNTADAQHEVDEEKWLSVMERVECAVFDGKRFHRQKDDKGNTVAANILPDSITREDRRRGKNTTVMVDGFAISKESMNCGDWEAVPTFAGKDPRLADPVKEKRREITHEEHCLTCFEGDETGHLVECKSCPRAYHYDCLAPEYKGKVKGFSGFYCSQHNCVDCGKNTTDAGGLIFRCRWCPQGFCEDCLDWDQTELVGQNLPEFEILGEPSPTGGFYIKCHDCVGACAKSKEQRKWTLSAEREYKEQHDAWLKERKEAEQQLERDAAALTSETVVPDGTIANDTSTQQNGQPPVLAPPEQREGQAILLDDTDVPSPPALTETSLPTPALGSSRVSTPKLVESQQQTKLPARAKRYASGDGYSETRFEKKARLDAQAWSVDNDPLLSALGGGR